MKTFNSFIYSSNIYKLGIILMHIFLWYGITEQGYARDQNSKCASIDPGTSLKGWQLNETNTGLVGVKINKEKLMPYKGPAKPAVGTNIIEKKITMQLDLSNGNITIERCLIQPVEPIYKGVSILHMAVDSKKPVFIRDCDIDGSKISDELIAGLCGFMGGGTIERCNIYNIGNGIAIWTTIPYDVFVENNFVHSLRGYGDPRTSGSHNEAFTIRACNGQKTIIRNNRFECVPPANTTASVFIQPYAGTIDNVIIIGNLLVAGGGYVLVLERHASHYTWGKCISAVNNRFKCISPCFGIGYVDSKGLTHGWDKWSDNYHYDADKPDGKGAKANYFTIK